MVNERFSLDALLDDRSRHSNHDEWKTMLTAVVIAASRHNCSDAITCGGFCGEAGGVGGRPASHSYVSSRCLYHSRTAYVVKPLGRPCPSSLWWFWYTICVCD